MAHTLAMEWAQYGIRVNSVSPGLVNTAMTYWVPQQPDWQQQLKYYGGFPRLAEVQELGGAYVYLLSDAASYTTSIDIPINGVIGSPRHQRSLSMLVLQLDRYSAYISLVSKIRSNQVILDLRDHSACNKSGQNSAKIKPFVRALKVVLCNPFKSGNPIFVLH